MELFHKKEKPFHYVEWFITDEESDDNWMGYLNHHITGTPGGELPFPDSSWTFEYHNSDALVYNLVHKALYENPEIDSTNIKVTVINSNVNLSGTVKRMPEIAEAEKVVRGIKEVWAVENQLELEKETGKLSSPLSLIS